MGSNPQVCGKYVVMATVQAGQLFLDQQQSHKNHKDSIYGRLSYAASPYLYSHHLQCISLCGTFNSAANASTGSIISIVSVS